MDLYGLDWNIGSEGYNFMRFLGFLGFLVVLVNPTELWEVEIEENPILTFMIFVPDISCYQITKEMFHPTKFTQTVKGDHFVCPKRTDEPSLVIAGDDEGGVENEEGQWMVVWGLVAIVVLVCLLGCGKEEGR